jgi:glycosyltransferase involved in cell wall biosynthesis
MEERRTVDGPLVSVLVPVYNVESFVEESLGSIAKQTYKNLEVIVVDDCSSDRTFELAERFERADRRFRVVRNEKNLQIAATLNRALSLARGQFIARCDGDDVMLPDRIERQYDYLTHHPDIALVGCSFVTIDERGQRLRSHSYPSGPELLHRLLPYLSPVSHIWLARRKLYEELVGYRLAAVEDYDFLLRADRRGFRFDNIPSYVGMMVRMRTGNTISKYGLRQRLLFNYARSLYLSGADHSEVVEQALRNPGVRPILRRLHFVSDRLTQYGARSRSRTAAYLLYVLGAIVSPYKAQYFWFQMRAAMVKRSFGAVK